jgi:hypothetical protein
LEGRQPSSTAGAGWAKLGIVGRALHGCGLTPCGANVLAQQNPERTHVLKQRKGYRRATRSSAARYDNRVGPGPPRLHRFPSALSREAAGLTEAERAEVVAD